MSGKAFVLLSGGVDSTTCLYLADRDFVDVEAVSIFYGQRHRKEIEYASRSCAALSIPHHTLDLSSIVPRTMLTDSSIGIPKVAYSEIEGVSPTYVPFRNGLMLSALTSYVAGRRSAEGREDSDEDVIYFGAHAEDAANWAYPDCTPEFLGAIGNAIFIGSYQGIRLATPLEWLGKQEIVRLGQSLKVNWSDTWSCYVGGELHCGVCPTCRARRDGFAAAGVADPTQYAETSGEIPSRDIPSRVETPNHL